MQKHGKINLSHNLNLKIVLTVKDIKIGNPIFKNWKKTKKKLNVTIYSAFKYFWYLSLKYIFFKNPMIKKIGFYFSVQYISQVEHSGSKTKTNKKRIVGVYILVSRWGRDWRRSRSVVVGSGSCGGRTRPPALGSAPWWRPSSPCAVCRSARTSDCHPAILPNYYIYF